MAKQFKGEIKLDIRDSTQDWDAFLPDKAPEGAPNVLVVLYDDTGLAAWSPYGGRIEMPTMDRLAENGLTYSQWHTTALCSPTRSVFLTGRNHHQNGFATISETSTGFPGYNSHIPRENATMATVLRDAGWSTFWVGKNHNIPVDAWTMGSSKKEWPLGLGYDRFYGFLGGETNQWYPDLAEDNHYVDQPYRPEDGYHLSKDLADKALEFIRDSKQSEPDKPWYLWFCPGANHAPHHAPQEYIDKYKGKFDDGYEAYREWVLPRMIERGHPARGHRADADQPDDRGHVQRGRQRAPLGHALRRGEALFSRMAEVYAASPSTPTHQVGRIVDYLEESGQLENTLIIYCADNGASGEGSPNGSVNENKFFNAWPDTIEDNLPLIDKLGSAGDLQPLPDRLGGRVLDALPDVQALQLPGRRMRPARDPLAGRASAARGEVRGQYHHCTDIVPTILDCCGVEMPDVVDGTSRRRCRASRCATRSTPADAPTRKETQYYEMLGTRGIWHKGWKAVAEHGPVPVGQGRLRQGSLAAVPHRRGPLGGARPRRRASGEARGAQGALARGGREVRRAAAQRPLDLRVPRARVRHPRAPDGQVRLLPRHR